MLGQGPTGAREAEPGSASGPSASACKYRICVAFWAGVIATSGVIGCSADTHGAEPRTMTSPFVGAMAGAGSPAVGLSCSDRDGDGIEDAVDGFVDQDGDGKQNADDTDSDGDGAEDSFERAATPCGPALDSDRDGTPDFLDLDSDGDGIQDAAVDRALDGDHDGMPDYRDADDDQDGISDRVEIGPNALSPVDTDRDGAPDFHDLDSDGDGLADKSGDGPKDTDGDGVLDHLDSDSDGDGIADTAEFGANLLMPRDTDRDGAPDYLDADSDSDGLHDGLEDKNGNGVLDLGESDPLVLDTDGDGADDLIESAAKTNARDPKANPQADGNFVFIVPFQQPPAPPDATLDFATNLVRADVVFSLDTTGSMDGEREQLQTALRTTIIPALAKEIPDLAFGVATFEDFPVFPFGAGDDRPVELHTPITTDAMVAQSAIDRLMLGSGGDGPESGAEALYQLATGAGVSWPGGQVAPFKVGWRDGALPIVVQITDAAMNSAETYMGLVPNAASLAKVRTALGDRGAKVIAVVSSDGDTVTATEEYLDVVRATGAIVPTSAFGGGKQCLTGIGGAPVAPDTRGECPLLFGIDGDGSGLGTSIVDAVGALAKYAVLDIDARAANEPGNKTSKGAEVDAIASVLDRVVPNPNPSSASGCVTGLATEDRLAKDTLDDTFVDVAPGQRVCFDVVAKRNATVESAQVPQLFRARIDLVGDGVTALDSRQVWFLVPPTPPKPGDKPIVM